MMTDDPIDLASMMPALDGLVARIDARCAPLVVARRAQPTMIQLAAWWRPALAAALLIGIVSSVILRREPPPPRAIPNATPELARALGVPTILADRLTSTAPPSPFAMLWEIGR